MAQIVTHCTLFCTSRAPLLTLTAVLCGIKGEVTLSLSVSFCINSGRICSNKPNVVI